MRRSPEAEAERDVLEVKVNWLQSDSGTRTAITRLTDDQLHEAEAAFRLLVGKP